MRFLCQLFLPFANWSRSLILIQQLLLSALLAALCFKRLGQGKFPGTPWIVEPKKKNGDSNSRS